MPLERRAQTLGVVAFATIGEVTGSLIWGVYHYRLHNLPLFVPPAHGLVYLTGLVARARARAHARALVVVGGRDRGDLGPARAHRAAPPRRRRRDRRAAAAGLPLALAQPRDLRRACSSSSPRSSCTAPRSGRGAGRATLPGLGIPDGNPPSGVASGYVWFDVMALLVAPYLLGLTRRLAARRPMIRAARGVSLGTPTPERRSTMKLLLTSAGIKNPSIQDALVDLLGQADCRVRRPLHPDRVVRARHGGFRGAWRFITGQATTPMMRTRLEVPRRARAHGAARRIDKEHWVPVVEEADVLLVNGGDALYLAPPHAGSPAWPTSCRR